MVSMKMYGLRKLHLHVMECGHSGRFLLTWSQKSFQEVIKFDRQLENTVQPLVGFGFYSSEIKDVDHEALRLALLKEVRRPAAHVPNCSVRQPAGCSEEEDFNIAHELQYPARDTPVQAESFQGRCHVCLTAQTKRLPRNQGPVSAHQEHQERNCAKQEQEPAARQIWYRFEGRSRPAEVRPGKRREAEENARKDLGITSENRIYLVVGGKIVSWEEVTKMEEDGTVEVTCAMRGEEERKGKRETHGTLQKKAQQEECLPRMKGVREKHIEKDSCRPLKQKMSGWKRLKKQLQEWSRKSSENGTMRRFVEQTAQMGPGQRDEAIRQYSEALQEFPEETREMAVSSIRWMVDEKAEEHEKARLGELIRRKDEEGYFRKCSGPDDEFDFGKHNGKSFKEVYLWDPGYCQWTLQQTNPQARKLVNF